MQRHTTSESTRDTQLRTSIRKYFADAGVTVEAVPAGVRVEGTEVMFNETDRRIGQAEPLIDHLISTSPLFSRLLSNAEQELCSELSVRAFAADGVIHIWFDDQLVAVVRGTQAEVQDPRPPVRGNFLAASKPWQTLRDRLTVLLPRGVGPTTLSATAPDEPTAKSSSLLVGRPARRTLRAHFPDSTPVDLADAATAASRELRYSRTVEYGHPVLLRIRDGCLRFAPIGGERPVRVRFECHLDDHHLAGALHLKSPWDPMALYVEEASSFPSMGIAWAMALIAYRDLTCLPGHSRQETVLPNNLSPTNRTQHLLASYVVGHRRHLPNGWSASDAAKAHARQIGIELSTGDTWVRPHARGMPADEELVFDWTPRLAVATAVP